MSSSQDAQVENRLGPSAASHDQLISVLVALDNDEQIVASTIASLHQVLQANYRFYEVVFIDNHSTDQTCDILVDQMQRVPHLRLVRLSQARDYEVVTIAALEHATGDFAVVFSPRLDRAEDIVKMVRLAGEGHDVVIAERQGMPSPGMLRRGVYSLVSKILKVNLKSEASDFRLMSRKVVAAITRIKHRRRNLKYFNAMVGYRQCTIKTRVRDDGVQFVQRRRLLQASLRAIDMVISNSALPLRAVTLLGLLASGLNLAYLCYVLVVTLVKEKLAEGWLTTSVMIGSMFCLLFLMLAVLAEYVARILEEVQHRPLYFVEMEAESANTWRRESTPLNVV